ncbi:MAG: cobalamin B12-binding domain-containing protein [Gammaproteobacteria bacterium]|nr:cobalamin B12-binding domain-containing protein [Gammaproteobacteria bacterium]
MTATKTQVSPAMHPIQVVSQRTGLSKDVIRAWEKRYTSVKPKRHTTTGRRLYSDKDIQRLSLLHKATRSGRRISDVSALSNNQLAELLANENAQIDSQKPNISGVSDYDEWLQPLIASINQTDEAGIYQSLANASTALPQIIFFEQVLSKALIYIGESWKKGDLRIGHEHLASIQIKRFLLNLLERELPVGPSLLVTTPVGQRHELGALMAAVIAAMEGWRCRYMGADMPATEIVAAAVASDSKGILLSLVSRADEKLLHQEITTLAHVLPEDMFVIIGGNKADRYAELFADINAYFCSDLRSLSVTLEGL